MLDTPPQAPLPASAPQPASAVASHPPTTAAVPSSAGAPGVSALAPQFDLALTASARRSAPPIGSLSPQGTQFGIPSPAHINHHALLDPVHLTPHHQHQQHNHHHHNHHHQSEQENPLRSPPVMAKDFLQEAETHSNFDFRSPNPSAAQAYSTSAASVPLHQHHDPLLPNPVPPQTAPLPQQAADFDLFGLATLDLGPPVFDPPLHTSPTLHQPLTSPTRLPHPSALFPPDSLHPFDPPPSPRKSPPAVSPPPALSPTVRSPREQAHPTRCVLLRNIPPGIDDDDIRSLLQQYGPLRDLGAQQRSRGGRGSVLATYYDLRHARSAVKALHEAVHFGRRLDARFQCPTDNTSMSGLGITSPVSTGSSTIGMSPSTCSNQGTLVVFNLDNSTSAEDIRNLFSEYGDVKEIRATPNKRHHKFVEFYDIRDAEKAMRSLNKTEVAGKRIKIEISRPGGRASNLPRNASPGNAKSQTPSMQHIHIQQRNHPSGNYVPFPQDISAFRNPSPQRQTIDPSHPSNQRIASGFLPAMHQGLSASTLPTLGSESDISPFEDYGGVGRDLANLISSKGFDSSLGHLQPSSYDGSHGNGQTNQEFEYNLLQGDYDALGEARIASAGGIEQRPDLHHMYSDPAAELNKFSNTQVMARTTPRYPADSYIKALYNSPDSDDSRKAMSPIQSPPGRSPFSLGKASGPGTGIAGMSLYKNVLGEENATGNAFPSSRIHNTNNANQGRRIGATPMPQGVIGGDRGYAARHANAKGTVGPAQNGGSKSYFNQQQGNSKYALDIRKVRSGEETRTALMIRNIPNKYNQKMLLSTLEEEHRGNFDFIYLPIDFKNKCNVGYAFINFTKPQYIEPFYNAFHGKKWGRFNSEKVCEITFARIQGRQQLIAHFQNSSLLLEDPKCRPVIFDAKGRQEEFPIGSHVRTRRGPSSRDSSHRACESSPPFSPTKHRGRGHA